MKELYLDKIEKEKEEKAIFYKKQEEIKEKIIDAEASIYDILSGFYLDPETIDNIENVFSNLRDFCLKVSM